MDFSNIGIEGQGLLDSGNCLDEHSLLLLCGTQLRMGDDVVWVKDEGLAMLLDERMDAEYGGPCKGKGKVPAERVKSQEALRNAVLPHGRGNS